MTSGTFVVNASKGLEGAGEGTRFGSVGPESEGRGPQGPRPGGKGRKFRVHLRRRRGVRVPRSPRRPEWLQPPRHAAHKITGAGETGLDTTRYSGNPLSGVARRGRARRKGRGQRDRRFRTGGRRPDDTGPRVRTTEVCSEKDRLVEGRKGPERHRRQGCSHEGRRSAPV